MNERFNNLLQSIKESTKNIKALPFEQDVLSGIEEKYDINPESLLGIIIHNCGGIVIDNWLRIYGAFYPFLWAQAEYLEGRRREQVPMKEIIGMEFEFLRQFGE